MRQCQVAGVFWHQSDPAVYRNRVSLVDAMIGPKPLQRREDSPASSYPMTMSGLAIPKAASQASKALPRWSDEYAGSDTRVDTAFETLLTTSWLISRNQHQGPGGLRPGFRLDQLQWTSVLPLRVSPASGKQ